MEERYEAKRSIRRLPETVHLGRLALVTAGVEAAGSIASIASGDLAWIATTSIAMAVNVGVLIHDGLFNSQPEGLTRLFRRPEPQAEDPAETVNN